MLVLNGVPHSGSASGGSPASTDGIAVRMIVAGNATGGATTRPVGFEIVDKSSGDSVAEELVLRFAVFDDPACSTLAENAKLSSSFEGEILSGSGSANVQVRTSASGSFRCTLTNTNDEVNYLACRTDFGGPNVDCRSLDTVAFEE